jgi:hypothetical protein
MANYRIPRPWPDEVWREENDRLTFARTIGNKAEAAYRRGDLFEKRRRLMADWARFCEAPLAGEVVSLRAGA